MKVWPSPELYQKNEDNSLYFLFFYISNINNVKKGKKK